MNGYRGTDIELPAYRRVFAVIQIDGTAGNAMVTISTYQPDVIVE